jgi:serine/threonine protein kinase
MALDTTLGVTRMGHYRLLRRIAVGGMAELFVAVARGAGDFAKPVAIKRILPRLAQEPHFLEMFFEEARLAASLDHPHIAKVIDFGEAEGLPYIVMEFVHGIDLRGLLSAVRRPLPIETAVTIIVQLAEALHHVHEHRDVITGKSLGLVHRDVSPSNVLLGYAGGVKLTDFGIVKPTESTEYTATGALKGKLPYLSPEQARCERLDRRTDVYAMGLVLYEITTGRRMHRAESEVGLLARVCEGVYTPPTAFLPEYDVELAEIVRHTLEPDVTRRYATAREVAADLEALALARQWSLSTGKLSEFIAAHVTDPSPVLLQPRDEERPTADAPTLSTTRRAKSSARGRQIAIAGALLALGVGPMLARSGTDNAKIHAREPEPSPSPPPASPVASPTAVVTPRASPALEAVDLEPAAAEVATTPPARAKKRRRASKPAGEQRLNKTLLPPSEQ